MNKPIAATVTLLVLLTTGCAPGIYKGLSRAGKENITATALYPFRHTPGQASYYATELKVRNNTINGILTILPDSANKNIRVAMTSVFGPTLFDFNITPRRMEVYTINPKLSYRFMLKTLEKDFRMILFKNLPQQSIEAKAYHETIDNKHIRSGYTINNKYGKFYYLADDFAHRLTQAESDGKLTRAEMSYEYEAGNSMPSKICIKHPVIKTTITLTPYTP